MAISVRTVDNLGAEIDLGYIPRFRPNKGKTTFAEDEGKTSNHQKAITFDQEQSPENQEYIIIDYKVTGGYSDKHLGLMIWLGRKKQYPVGLK